jgi:uncharacterized membrane protein YeaQ/YmgE (transglycosylase-associated protein family)
MTLFEFFLFLLIAGLAGAVGQAIAGFSRGGCLVSIAVGFIGALLGTWIAREMSLPELLLLRFGDQQFPLIWAILGASLFAAVLGLVTRPRRPIPPPA